MTWYWISLTSDAGFLGAAIAQAASAVEAVQTAVVRSFVTRHNVDNGLALHGEIKVSEVPAACGAPPPRFVGHLLGEPECEALRASWFPDWSPDVRAGAR